MTGPRRRPPRPPLLAAVALGAACAAGAAGTQPVEVSLECPVAGLCTTNISVGTPPQPVKLLVDSGSGVLWVSNASHAFVPETSSTFQAGHGVDLPTRADGFQVQGLLAHDVVAFPGSSDGVSEAPLVVRDAAAANASALAAMAAAVAASLLPPEVRLSLEKLEEASGDSAVGVLGLNGCSEDQRRAWKETEADKVLPFFCHYWGKASADTPRTIRLEVGRSRPRMVIGGDLGDIGLRFAAALPPPSPPDARRWSVSVRALGIEAAAGWSFFSMKRPSEIDFNSQLPYGEAALLDSGSAVIRVGSDVFAVILRAFPSGCRRSVPEGVPQASIVCACDSVETLPTLTFSIEAASNVRLFGLDAGADFLSCVPPAAYATYDGSGMCSAAIVDGGPRHAVFGARGIVLGLPFFRSAPIAYDYERGQVAIGESSEPGFRCACTDPKNWWSTGRRLSARRIFFSLFSVTAFCGYVYITYSSSTLAGTCRSQLGTLGSRLASAGASAGQRLHSGGGSARAPGLQHTGPGRALDDTAPEVQLHDQTSFVALNSDADA